MNRRNRVAGFSLVELIVVMAIASVLLLLSYDIMDGSVRLGVFLEASNDMTVLSQRPLLQVQNSITQSRVVFGEDTIGTAYRTAVEARIPSSRAVAPGTRLPVFDQSTTAFVPDGATRRTGNAILMVVQVSPLEVSGDAGFTFHADRYYFEYVYPTRNSSRGFAGNSQYVDLARFRSVTFADYFQLSNATANLTDPQKRLVAERLHAEGITVAWEPGLAPAQAFRAIPATSLSFAAPLASPQITMRECVTLLPEMSGGRINGKIEMSVGFRPSTPFAVADAIPRFAATGTSLPRDCGFEVKVVGPPGARKVLTRLVLLSRYSVSRLDSEEGFVITSYSR